MIDVGVLIREYLLGQSEVTGLLGTNANGSIYVAYDLPEHFTPTLGPAIQIYRAGGHSHPEIIPLVDARVMIRAWADVEEYTIASTLYSAINDVLHGLCGAAVPNGTIVRALEADGPLEMTDPETGWVAMYAFYQVMARPNSGAVVVYIPQFYEGDGGPVALHNNDDIYYDTSTGNLYEQVFGAWQYMSNISGSGTAANIVRYDNGSVGGLTATGNPAVWQLAVEFTANAMVFRNGQLLEPGADYTTTGDLITYTVDPSSGDYLAVMLVTSGSGGATEMSSTVYHQVAATGLNAATIKSAPGVVTGWKIYNNANYPVYVKLFDLSSFPNPGSSQVKQTIGVDAGEQEVAPPGPGTTYLNGIGIAITKYIADNDNTPVAAGDCVVDIFYQ